MNGIDFEDLRVGYNDKFGEKCETIRDMIISALRRGDGPAHKAAEILGICRHTLYRHAHIHGVSVSEHTKPSYREMIRRLGKDRVAEMTLPEIADYLGLSKENARSVCKNSGTKYKLLRPKG